MTEAVQRERFPRRPSLVDYSQRCLWFPTNARSDVRWLREFIHQTQRELSLEESAMAMNAVALLRDFGFVHLPVKRPPFKDEFRLANERTLAKGLVGLVGPEGTTPRFELGVRNGIGGDDGAIWSDIDLQFASPDDGLHFWAPVRGVPLEIGQIRYRTTVERLVAWGGLARWPYGRDVLTIAVRRPGIRSHGAAL